MRIIYFFHPTETLVSLAKQKKKKIMRFFEKGTQGSKIIIADDRGDYRLSMAHVSLSEYNFCS